MDSITIGTDDPFSDTFFSYVYMTNAEPEDATSLSEIPESTLQESSRTSLTLVETSTDEPSTSKTDAKSSQSTERTSPSSADHTDSEKKSLSRTSNIDTTLLSTTVTLKLTTTSSVTRTRQPVSRSDLSTMSATISSSASIPTITSTVSATSSPSATSTTTQLPDNSTSCHPGTKCAWQMGVGLSFGCVAVIAIMFVVCFRYRKSLMMSRQSYREGRRKLRLGRDTTDEDSAGSLNMTQLEPTIAPSPPPTYGQKDELFLPKDVQQVVDKVQEMRNQSMRLPTNSYGSVLRKPLTDYRDF